MRYVDHDPAAARAAALQCRVTAQEYLRIASIAAVETIGAAWWGAERERVVAEVEALAADLRREALRLRETAYGLEVAARAAERRNADLAAEAAAAAAAAAVCPPTASGHGVGSGPAAPRRRGHSSDGAATRPMTVPTGTR